MKIRHISFLMLQAKWYNSNRSAGKGKWFTYTFRIRLDCAINMYAV